MKYIIVLAIFFNSTMILGQIICPTNGEAPIVAHSRNSSNNCTKIVAVNMHFVSDNNGNGNFTQNRDEKGSTCIGCAQQLAERTFERINREWRDNEKLWAPVDNNTPVENINIQFELKGVYYHKNSNLFNTTERNFNNFYPYAKNDNAEINVFITNSVSFTRFTGIAIGIGPTNLPLLCKAFINKTNLNDNSWHRNIAHEIGHLLNLAHTHSNDNCNDTYRNPAQPVCWLHGSIPECTQWGHNLVNTFMAYTGYKQSMSPCQLDRMHGFLESRPSFYRDAVVPYNFALNNKNYISGVEEFDARNRLTSNNTSIDLEGKDNLGYRPKFRMNAKNEVELTNFEVTLGCGDNCEYFTRNEFNISIKDKGCN